MRLVRFELTTYLSSRDCSIR